MCASSREQCRLDERAACNDRSAKACHDDVDRHPTATHLPDEVLSAALGTGSLDAKLHQTLAVAGLNGCDDCLAAQTDIGKILVGRVSGRRLSARLQRGATKPAKRRRA